MKRNNVPVNWEAIFQVIDHPVIILDPCFNVVAANRASQRLTGKSHHDIIGRKCYAIFHGAGPDIPPEGCPLQKRLASGHRETTEMEMESLGSFFHLSCTPVFDEQGNLDKIVHIATDITERKRDEKELRQSEELYRADFDRAPVARCLVSLNGRFLRVNHAFCRMLGYSEHELMSMTFAEVTHPEDLADSNEWVQHLLEGEITPPDLEKRYVHKAGHVVWGLVRAILLYDAQGTPLHFSTHVQDITGRRQAEEALRENEAKFRAIFENSLDAIGVSINGVTISMNPAHFALFGYSSGTELAGKPILELIAPKERKRILEYTERRERGESAPNAYETRGIRKDGTEFDMEVHVSSYPLDGEIYTLATLRDITERRRAEQLIAESLNFTKAIISTSPIGIFTYRASGPCVSANESAARIIGTTVNTLTEQNFHKIESWKQSGLYAIAMESLETERPVSSEIHIITTFHADRWVYAVCTPFQSAGEPHLLLMLNDVTERKQAEAALLEAQGFSADLIRYSAAAVFVLDTSHRIMLWNKACEELTGRHEAEMIGTDDQWKPFYGNKRPTVADVIIDRDLDRLPKLYRNYSQSALNPQGIKVEGWYKNVGGKDRYLVFEASPIYNSTGELIAAIETLEDLTEGKRLEEQLLQAQKMEAIGVLAGGVAHDFNNILSAIVGYANLMLLKMPANDPLNEHLEAILRASERAATLTRSLLSFSRKQVINPTPIGLNDLVLRYEDFLTRLIREDITIDTTCAGGDLTIFADHGQIEQLLMNLVTNARDAMPTGGTITIQTQSVHFDKPFIKKHGYGKPGRYALLTVSDTGEGIDTKIKRKIFEPFFTTKEQGKGTGLGLSMVYGIVQQHNGYIDVTSKRGRGTAFNIYLPLLEGTAVPERRETVKVPLQGGLETILIAEDNADIRNLFSIILREHGYVVINAVDGDDAVIKFREHKDQVKLIVLDGIMPKKNGKEAYEEILAINPSIKAIFVSGYAEDIFSRKGLLKQGINFIQKPVSLEALLKTVREVLDA